MRKIKLYIACSLNGKISRADGSVDWLDSFSPADDSDFGYTDFYNSIDTTIQGYSTYKQIIDWGIDFPYEGKENFVITNKKSLKDTRHVKIVKTISIL